MNYGQAAYVIGKDSVGPLAPRRERLNLPSTLGWVTDNVQTQAAKCGQRVSGTLVRKLSM